ncbi:glycoside hydrolase family 3 C-terminal domain-containing protein [Agaribacterium haliotis]|uniref:glycoside hydrolase family 3 C-terminal domain-containing protein n=1 Tax=Agaribacterium haliotis TaxID=2013869 RepID=UPI000BB52D16|nr:glycoside hydrolase family 3 C-terminal domain-containing protein [Agaribacterium haliotis]
MRKLITNIKLASGIALFSLSAASYASQAHKHAEHIWFDENLSFEQRSAALVAAMSSEEKIAQLSEKTPAIARLGLNEYVWWNEALHGVARNGRATIFPQIIGLAASFDDDLAFRMADAISTEARAKYNLNQQHGNRSQYTGLTFWSPNVNIFRDPRWGRGQETSGESPLLNARIGGAFVKGMQGDHPKYLKTSAAAKHFGVHSGPEAERHSFDARASAKDLYETYLPAFESLITDAKVTGLMCAYNAVDGVPACASEFLLDELAKKQWGFDGYIVSDCGALYDIHHGHKYKKTEAEAAAVALQTGVNLNCGFTYPALADALKQGLIDEKLIDEKLQELLMIRFRLGFFDKPESNPYNDVSIDVVNSQEHIALAREVAQKSIVLLKNDNNTLPLKKDIKVPYVTGPFASSSDVLMANYYGISGNMVTILEGIANKLSMTSSLNYRMGALPFHENLNPLNWAPMVAKTADATIAVVGISADMEGEEVDAIASQHKGDRVDISLPKNQVDYIKTIAKNKTGPLILVVASGSPVALGELHDLADAVLQVWYPGEQGGNAVADVIFGDINPSGHLPLTFPKSVEQLPDYSDYSMVGRTYKFMQKEPLYPFGFGLSYTEFKYSQLQAELQKNGALSVSVNISNTGEVAGEDVAQVYLAPTEADKQEALYVLKDFKRVALEAGQSKTLRFEIPADKLTRINMQGKKIKLSGKYKLYVANALPSKRSQALGASKAASRIVYFK